MMEEMENNKELESNLNENQEEKNAGEQVTESEAAKEIDEITQLRNTIEELQKQNEMLKDQLLRKAADFENYKRRIENDIISITKFANEDLIEKLLPIIDDFERFLEHSKKENTANNAFYKGVELIYGKLIKLLELQGLKKIDCIGQQFDVNYHDALLVVPSNDPAIAANTIIQEVEKGYILNDKIIRHAKVIVAGESSSIQNNNQEGGAD